MTLLYFLHIPKTAGTSVIHALDQRLTPAAILSAQLIPQLDELAPGEIERALFVRGHLGARIAESLGRRAVTFTLLRDPVRRTVSHYLHVQREPTHYFHGLVDSLEGFIEHPLTRPLVENYQARHLVLSAVDALPVPNGFEDHPQARQIAHDTAPLPADLEAAAFAGLAAIDFVGVVDDGVEAALARLASRLGWRESPLVGHERVSPRPAHDELTPELEARIRALTTLDAVLVDAARRRHDGGAPASWTWDPACVACGSGWHDAQFHPAHGWHRWTGPDTAASAELDGPDRGMREVELAIDVISAAAPELYGAVEAEIDGRPVVLGSLQGPGCLIGHADLGGAVPRVVRLRVPRTQAIGLAHSGTDAPVGIAISRIQLAGAR